MFFKTNFSVWGSIELVGSSKRRIFGSVINVLVIDMACLCPPERISPRSFISDAKPSGMLFAISSTPVIFE